MRVYFRDLGVARYFLKKGIIRGAAAEGYINENFVYIDLIKRIERMEIGGTSPVFGTYKDGEIEGRRIIVPIYLIGRVHFD